MDPVEQFHRHAERLEALAERASSPKIKRQCLRLAQLWRRMASFVARERSPDQGSSSD
jgi:hypothetical protein